MVNVEVHWYNMFESWIKPLLLLHVFKVINFDCMDFQWRETDLAGFIKSTSFLWHVGCFEALVGLEQQISCPVRVTCVCWTARSNLARSVHCWVNHATCGPPSPPTYRASYSVFYCIYLTDRKHTPTSQSHWSIPADVSYYFYSHCNFK